MNNRSCPLLLLFFLSCLSLAQDRNTLLEQINNIKKNTDCYLYGLSTVPGEPDSNVSHLEAYKELLIQVENYLEDKGFIYLKQKKEIPDDVLSSITCLLRPDCYRTIVYLEKEKLRELEQAISDQMNDHTRAEALKNLLDAILLAQNINEVLDIIASSPLGAEIKAGQSIGDDTQQYANDGLLVYFEPKSKRILEIMTPMDDNNSRLDLKSGTPAQPLKYKYSPLWIYIEGLKNHIAL